MADTNQESSGSVLVKTLLYTAAQGAVFGLAFGLAGLLFKQPGTAKSAADAAMKIIFRK